MAYVGTALALVWDEFVSPERLLKVHMVHFGAGWPGKNFFF